MPVSLAAVVGGAEETIAVAAVVGTEISSDAKQCDAVLDGRIGRDGPSGTRLNMGFVYSAREVDRAFSKRTVATPA